MTVTVDKTCVHAEFARFDADGAMEPGRDTIMVEHHVEATGEVEVPDYPPDLALTIKVREWQPQSTAWREVAA